MVTVEELYKNFGVLADAKEKAGEVNFPRKEAGTVLNCSMIDGGERLLFLIIKNDIALIYIHVSSITK